MGHILGKPPALSGGWAGGGWSMRAGRAFPGGLSYQVKGDGHPLPLKGQSALPIATQTHISIFSSLVCWLSSVCPMSISILLRCARSWPVRTRQWALRHPASVGLGPGKSSSGDGRRQGAVGFRVLVLRHPWRVTKDCLTPQPKATA